MHKRHPCFLIGIALLGVSVAPGLRASPSADYLKGLRAAVTQNVQNLPAIVKAAEVAAKKLVDGGKLYVVGDEQGFPIELLGRAGGLIMVRLFPADWRTVTAADVVLVGTLSFDLPRLTDLIQKVRQRGALTVGFGVPGDPVSQLTDYYFGVEPRHGLSPTGALAQRLKDCRPLFGPPQIMTAWTFTAELVAACTRQGRLPSIYQSVGVPGGRERNATMVKDPFVPEAQVTPIPARQLGKAYLQEIWRDLLGLEQTQLPKYARAGAAAAQAINSGHKVVCQVIGHHLDGEVSFPDIVQPFKLAQGKKPEEVASMLDRGDVFLYVGYYFSPTTDAEGKVTGDMFNLLPLVEAIKEKPITRVWIWSALKEPFSVPKSDLVIDPQWKYGDACVKVAGCDVNALPPSGVIGTASYWMLVEETVSRLAPS